MSSCFFVFNNLKVNSFLLGDAPLPGFELVAWDCWTMGTLWSLNTIGDAGFTTIGITKVHGQLWRMEDPKQVPMLEQCFGKDSGLVRPVDIDIVVDFEYDKEKLKARTYALEMPVAQKLSPNYSIVADGKWSTVLNTDTKWKI